MAGRNRAPAQARLEVTGERRWRVQGDMDFQTVGALLRAGEQAFATPGDVEVDLSAVGRTDSAGLALLLEWARAARQGGGELRLRAVPAQLTAIAAVSGLDDTFLADHSVAESS